MKTNIILSLILCAAIPAVALAQAGLILNVRQKSPVQRNTGKDARTTENYGSKTASIEIEIRNTSSDSKTFKVEWYFFSKDIRDGDHRIFDSGSTGITMKASDIVKIGRDSQAIELRKVVQSNGKTRRYGEDIEGYIVYLKDAGSNILAAKAYPTSLATVASDPEKLKELLKPPAERK